MFVISWGGVGVILKGVIEKTLKSVEEDDVEIKIVNYIEVVKKKLLVVKKLEEEIIEISDDTETLERIINEGTEYEVLIKTNIGRLQNVCK